MGEALDPDGRRVALFEDFTDPHGSMWLVTDGGEPEELPKSLEPTWADPAALHLGRPYSEVGDTDTDLLGRLLLADGGDPRYEQVAGALEPIRNLATASFVGTPGSPDKVGTTLDGRTAHVDPAAWAPEIVAARDAGRVASGLVGGWLPVLRYAYPDALGPDGADWTTWSELLLFAPDAGDGSTGSGNARIQAVWYRIARIEHGRLVRVAHLDTYPPTPPRGEPAAGDCFLRDLLVTRESWARELAGAAAVDVPDRRLADQARHSLVRARMTRVDDWPKYGVQDRNYGGSEHDGFQDTFTVDLAAALDWGLLDVARRYVDNYLGHFVRDDGSVVYRGPGTGQYGRMLTVLAQYHRVTGDTGTLLRHRTRIDAIARLLRDLGDEHGIPVGWCEADSSLEVDPERYRLPYVSSGAEAVRGWTELGAVWARIGAETGDRELAAWGSELTELAGRRRADLLTFLDASVRRDLDPPWLPVIAGATVPHHLAVAADDLDPQFRAYRANGELLHSGVLDAAQVATILDYRGAHRDIALGVPVAYAGALDRGAAADRELAGFLAYAHAWGLLHHDRIREYLLCLYSLSAHQYTRGTWTAPETRRITPGSEAAPYCTPAQLAVPLLLRWALVWEQPDADVLWLGRACPRAWFAGDAPFAIDDAPTRWGAVSFRIEPGEHRVLATVRLPARESPEVRLRLRLPAGRRIRSVEVDGRPETAFDADAETMTLRGEPGAEVRVVAALG